MLHAWLFRRGPAVSSSRPLQFKLSPVCRYLFPLDDGHDGHIVVSKASVLVPGMYPGMSLDVVPQGVHLHPEKETWILVALYLFRTCRDREMMLTSYLGRGFQNGEAAQLRKVHHVWELDTTTHHSCAFCESCEP